MKRYATALAVFVLAGLLAAGSILAQRPGQRNRPNAAGRPNPAAQQRQAEEPKRPELPDDPKLLELHRDFVVKAARLAKDYERGNQIDKARACYEQILKLVPGHPDAEEALANIQQKEATAQRRTIEVHANKGWQDTGVVLIAGKPVSVHAEGSWSFRMSHQLGPDGMEIPEELRDFNLGSLVGLVAAGDPEEARPFFIGSSKEFRAPLSGPLMLRMYDSDPSDNAGKLSIEIRGTFERP
ncbi:MAG: hypothetical protein WD403_02030 [Pirellulales bacterium]